MSVKFNRVDYAQVGTTNKACLQVIRGEKDEKEAKKSKKVKSGDKIVVGAQNGILLCFSRTSGDTNIAFKTPPGPPISCVRLGGALQTTQDKTFVAADAEVKGYSRKGKQFLAFQTNMTERITSMFVYGVDMFLCGRNSFYHFHDCIEKSSYVCADRITDVLCLPVTEGGWVGRGITPVLACEDKSLKVLSGNSVSCELHLTDVPNTLHLFMNDGGYNKQKVLYGTKNGTLGLADIRENDVIISWEISTKTPAGITAICCYRITGNNFPDVIIGKEDGLVEIYTVDEADEQCDESITGLECGKVGSEMYDEIVICTYTGWVFALTTEPTVMPQPAEGLTPQLELKVQQLRSELEELELKVREERDRYQEMTKTQEDTLAIVPPFTVNDRFALNKELACYTLFIELVIPIDYLLLQVRK
ncbi:CBN-OSM-12 protein [Aphelenchoides avenae]|nr:CBN-OSM-12 protein [Aphelenchus avenae]